MFQLFYIATTVEISAEDLKQERLRAEDMRVKLHLCVQRSSKSENKSQSDDQSEVTRLRNQLQEVLQALKEEKEAHSKTA